MWTYKKVSIYSAARNSSGIRWYAFMGIGLCLRADTKQEMKHLINLYQEERNEI